MTTLHKIEELLNIEIGDKVLRNGRIYNEKNRYYWYRNEYYIVNIGDDKWVIMLSNDHTREMLDDYIWRCLGGYAISDEGRGKTKTLVKMHRKLMHMDNNPLVVDHIKRNKFDNRLENLRIVTHKVNNQNKSISSNNTSGITGISKRKMGIHEYYETSIVDNNNVKHQKKFSITKLGDIEARRQAILQRMTWKEQYFYLGE